MRKSILQDLYFGKIRPWERKRIPTEEYDTLTQKRDDIEAHFKETLSPEEYAKLEEMQDLQSEAELIDNIALFEYSFCLGAMMMIDIFGFKENY